MTVRNGRDFLAIPGPTPVPDAVLRAMHAQPVDIYAGPLTALTESLLADLRKVFRTQGRAYIYAANGHGAWEAALTNTLSRGDRVLVAPSGRFAAAWGDMAKALGAEAETLPGSQRRAVDPAALEARLRADAAGAIRAVLAVHIDTASGAANDIPALRRAIDAAGHPALLAVDTVASLAAVPFEMDAWGVDVAVAAAQKGLAMAPGLSFTAAGPRALEAHRRAGLRTPYWDWTARDGSEHYMKYCGTPPEQLLFGLRAALDLLFDEGLEAAFARHRILAGAARRAVAAWAAGGALSFNVEAPAQRADSVTVVRVAEPWDPEALRRYCDLRCGVALGFGIGALSGRAFRIAHMGHINAPALLGTLGAVEMGLAALGIPHGRGGVQAAIDRLAEAVPPPPAPDSNRTEGATP